MFYCFFNMFGMLGRISVAVYFYMYCVQNFTFITVFMMMQMIVGTLITPFTPKIMEKMGKRNTAILSMVIQEHLCLFCSSDHIRILLLTS